MWVEIFETFWIKKFEQSRSSSFWDVLVWNLTTRWRFLVTHEWFFLYNGSTLSYKDDPNMYSVVMHRLIGNQFNRCFLRYRPSVSIITNSGTTLCAHCPEQKLELGVHLFKWCCPFLHQEMKKIMASSFIVCYLFDYDLLVTFFSFLLRS